MVCRLSRCSDRKGGNHWQARSHVGAGLLGGTTAAGVQATTSAVAKAVKDKEPRVPAVDDFDEKWKELDFIPILFQSVCECKENLSKIKR